MFTIESIAERLHAAPEDVAALIREAVAPTAQRAYYHYLARPRPPAERDPEGSRSARPRTVLLFRSPDEALAFAKLARIPETPQVRPIDRAMAILHMLGDERIERVVFLEEDLLAMPPGMNRERLAELPGAYVIDRAALLDRLSI